MTRGYHLNDPKGKAGVMVDPTVTIDHRVEKASRGGGRGLIILICERYCVWSSCEVGAGLVRGRVLYSVIALPWYFFRLRRTWFVVAANEKEGEHL